MTEPTGVSTDSDPSRAREADHPVGGISTEGAWRHPWRVRGSEPVYEVGLALLRVVVVLLLRLRVAGRLPREGALIVASNHVSYLDPATLGIALGRLGRRGRYLATAELFTKPLLGPALWTIGFIPVRPGRGATALAAGIQALRAGEVVVIYPEGHVARGRVLPARPGVARLSRATGTPVVPVAQVGMERGDRRLAWVRRRRAAVLVGEPFLPPDGMDDDAAAAEVLDRIRALVPAARVVARGSGAGRLHGRARLRADR